MKVVTGSLSRLPEHAADILGAVVGDGAWFVTARGKGRDDVLRPAEPSILPIKVQMSVEFRSFFTFSIVACGNGGRGALKQ